MDATKSSEVNFRGTKVMKSNWALTLGCRSRGTKGVQGRFDVSDAKAGSSRGVLVRKEVPSRSVGILLVDYLQCVKHCHYLLAVDNTSGSDVEVRH